MEITRHLTNNPDYFIGACLVLLILCSFILRVVGLLFFCKKDYMMENRRLKQENKELTSIIESFIHD